MARLDTTVNAISYTLIKKTLEKFPALDETELSRRTSRDRSAAGKYNFCPLISNLCSSNTLSPKMDRRVEKRGANITNFHPNQIQF